MRCCGAAGKAVAEPGGDGGGHEEEHGAGVEEAVADPLGVEEACGLSVEGAEEALEASGGEAGIKDAGVAGLPGCETDEKGEGDGKPSPEDGWGKSGFVWFGRELEAGGGEEGVVEVGEGFAEFAEGDEAEEESRSGKDGEEVAEDKDELRALGPVHAGWRSERQGW